MPSSAVIRRDISATAAGSPMLPSTVVTRVPWRAIESRHVLQILGLAVLGRAGVIQVVDRHIGAQRGEFVGHRAARGRGRSR